MRKHLTFGFGVHHCLGSELARTQLVIASGWDRWRGLTELPVRVAR